MRFLTILAALLFSLQTAHAADDAALYDPAPPADSAFVRVINAAEGGPVDVSLGANSFSKVAFPGISAYQIVPQGAHSAKLGGDETDLTITAGKYYSLAVVEKDGKKEIVQIEDPQIKNPAKALITFYNLSDAPAAALYAAAQKADIFPAVKTGDKASREVNALTIDVAVKDAEGKEVSSFKGIELKRKSGVNFLLAGNGAAKKAIMAASEVASKK